jgi:heptosyltransferase-2
MKPGADSLIVAPQWIGDAVMTEPLLRRLAERGERLTVAALPWVAPVYQLMPQVTEVIELPFAHGALQWNARYGLARRIKGRFDAAYVCPNSLKSALLPFLAGIRQRVGYLGEARFGLLTRRLKNPPRNQRPPMVAFYSALSGESNLAMDQPQLRVDEVAVELTLQQLGLSGVGYYVFAPGAEFGPAKRWPTSHFVDLARCLDKPVVLLGSAKEQALCDEIAVTINALQTGRCTNLAGRTNLTQAFHLIATAQCTISNDSGMMHVAAALGVRQVAIFGSSSPLHTPPLNARAGVLWLKNEPDYQPALDCAPCFERSCRFGHTRCLSDISASQVLQHIERLNRI